MHLLKIMSAKHYAIVVLSLVICGDCLVGTRAACVSPCESYCAPGDFAGDPNNCTKFLQCGGGGTWISGMSCSTGLVFDTGKCICDYAGNCQGPCPTEDPNQTAAQPGLCEGISSSCSTVGDFEPDRSACEYYYECDFTYAYVRKQCTSQSSINFDCSGGTACVYDIYSEKCVVPYTGFICDYRCVTTIAPSTSIPTTSLTSILTESTINPSTSPTTESEPSTLQIVQSTPQTVQSTPQTVQLTPQTVFTISQTAHTSQQTTSTAVIESTTSLHSTEATSESPTNVGAIVGGIIGAVVVICGGVFIGYWVYERKKRAQVAPQDQVQVGDIGTELVQSKSNTSVKDKTENGWRSGASSPSSGGQF